jgi:predicted nuclease of restriction endonuclease-like (RecB) superfamily
MSLNPQPADFSDIADLIAQAKQRAVQAVNTTLIELYWTVGERISRKIAMSEWGDGVVEQLARYLAQTQPGLRGFTRRNLFRMKQFYEAYEEHELVPPLVTQLPWTHHLIILSQSKRQLERQFKTALFERTVLHPSKVSAVLSQTHTEAGCPCTDRPELVEGLLEYWPVVRPFDRLSAHYERGKMHYALRQAQGERELTQRERGLI